MKKHAAVVLALAAAAPTISSRLLAQAKPIEPDLAALAANSRLQGSNRTVTVLVDGQRKGVHLDERPGDDVAYLPGIELANGTIELDVRGKDVLQQSFVGIAFHGVDGATLEAVYFRPFNFTATDSARRAHAVQYVSHPQFPWDRLRATQPGKYEQPVHPVPDPNGWFHVRIVIAAPKVSVFVNDATEGCLVVDQLSDRKTGRVGLWVGNNSGGDFANLRITP